MNDPEPVALADHRTSTFGWRVEDRVATVILDRPARKNALTFATYAELRDLFSTLRRASDVRCVVVTGSGGDFCSGGDVHEIIGPLTRMSPAELHEFTRMTCDLILHMRTCPQPVLAAVDGVCAGAGAMIALASDLRFGTPRASVAFLFARVGLAGCDMGACSMLPRMIGLGRATELLLTGRAMTADEARDWGFFNRLCAPDTLASDVAAVAHQLAHGPTLAHATTKRMLLEEWSVPLPQALEMEAEAQACCMQTADFLRAYEAFVRREKPEFLGR